MGNAIPEAKAVADVVTASNDADGIGLVLQQYFG
jgi:hydroxymethylpyrimidine pyrophosphatase-like HAD family hydrolase